MPDPSIPRILGEIMDSPTKDLRTSPSEAAAAADAGINGFDVAICVYNNG